MDWIWIGAVCLLAAALVCFALTKAASHAEELGNLRDQGK